MDELKRYLEEQRKAGFNDDEIKKALIQGGWKEEQFREAFTPAPALPEKALDLQAPPPPAQELTKRKHNIWAIILFFLLFSMIIGGCIAAVWWFWLSPQKQLFGAYQQLKDLKSFSYTMTVEFNIKNGSPDVPLPFLNNIGNANKLTLTGAMEKVDERIVNFSALVNLPTGFGKLDIRAIDRIIYGKLEGGSTEIIQTLGTGLEQFYNQWYSYEIERIKENFGEGFLPSESILTGKQYDELSSLLAKHRFLKVKQDKRLDEINDRRLRYIILTVDKDKLIDFLFESQKILLVTKEHKTRQEIEEMYGQDDAFIDKASFHIWLDMKSFPVRLKWVFEDPDFSISTTIDLSDINQKALIIKPEGKITSLNDLIKQLQEESEKQQGKDTSVDKSI